MSGHETTPPTRADAIIRWKVLLRTSPEQTFDLIATPGGRARFWAESAEEVDGTIRFVFRDGSKWASPILARIAPRLFRISYFEGSVATFSLTEAEGGSTELTLTETDVPSHAFQDNHAGWVSVLLNLKAVADFGVDLRNGDAQRGWSQGYVDV